MGDYIEKMDRLLNMLMVSKPGIAMGNDIGKMDLRLKTTTAQNAGTVMGNYIEKTDPQLNAPVVTKDGITTDNNIGKMDPWILTDGDNILNNIKLRVEKNPENPFVGSSMGTINDS